jgi:2-polyprenyl-6-methoxyphenol hydroxylase-like FAD-dependent oxidoreductase
MMTNLHVLIIGGGVGGLCLAQGLKQSGISVAVYERDKSVHFRYQGYRIHINTDGSRALHDCLPENLFSLFVATSSKPITGRFTIFDLQLKEQFSRLLPRAVADPSFLLRTDVNRLTLREILLAGLEGMVHFGKTLERFEQVEGGQVCAYFADGTSATGDLLIGADGSNSVTRNLIVPDAKLADTGRVIYGKTPLTTETMQWIPDSWVYGFSRAAGPGGVGIGAGAYRKREPFAEAVAKYSPSLHLSETQDYLMWTLNVSLEQLAMSDEQFRDADGTTLQAVARDLVEEWHPVLRRLVDEADIPATFPISLHYAEPVKQWQTTNVTLLGDAIHTMPPSRGEGANTALRDAELLHHKLVDVATKEVSLLQAKVEYETAMLEYGFEAVTNSIKKPFFGPSLAKSE